ncbi:MAG: hypothetical protein K2K18_03310 [Malacoplasma sp.]|nr:hypothetical protein [Malacoplasma sp.]
MNKLEKFFEIVSLSFYGGSEYNGTNDAGQYNFYGHKSWVYYLFGAIFLVLTLLSLWYTWKVRHSKKEYENIAISFNWWKKFWYEHRFAIMILVTVALFMISIAFFTLNLVIIEPQSE